MAAELASDLGSYLEIRYRLDAPRFRNSKVSDLYTFSDSMLQTNPGKNQLAELVAALKIYYAIV